MNGWSLCRWWGVIRSVVVVELLVYCYFEFYFRIICIAILNLFNLQSFEKYATIMYLIYLLNTVSVESH